MTPVTTPELVKVGAHFGHKTTRWNPKMKPYLYGARNGIHIHNLEQTAAALNQASQFFKKLKNEGKTILFVSTKQQTIQSLPAAAQKCHLPYVAQKWFAGLLTNFDTIKGRIKYLKDLKAQKESGELEKYTKKEQRDFEKEIAKLEIALGGVAEMEKIPNALFVLSAVRDNIAVKEAKKLKIPVVAIVDSDGDPSEIDIVIPGNDDALKALNFYLEKISEELS